MDNNTAYAYRLDENYLSIYVNLKGYDQIIFYWSPLHDCEKRKPKWRETKETILEDMKIVSCNHFGCVLEIKGKQAKFEWYEYDRPNNVPAHKGRLINFADWEYDPEFQHNSPTSFGIYSGYYNGSYHSPEYDRDLDPFYNQEDE